MFRIGSSRDQDWRTIKIVDRKLKQWRFMLSKIVFCQGRQHSTIVSILASGPCCPGFDSFIPDFVEQIVHVAEVY